MNGAPVIVKKKKERTKERKLKIYRSASDPDISTFALARDDMNAFFVRLLKKRVVAFTCGCLGVTHWHTLLKYQHGTQDIFD